MYFLRPDAFDVIGHLAPSKRGEFEITDVLNHYIPDGRLFTRVYEGHWTDAGTVPSLLRASELARDDDAVGRLSPPSERPIGSDRRAPTARDFGRILVTGGAGFIGSCYVRDVLGRRDGTEITVLDKLTYAGNEANLAPVRDDPEQAARLRFVMGDIADRDVVDDLVRDVDAVINFAAESHVDRSILDPEAFLRDRRHRRPRPAGGVPDRAAAAALPAGLDRRGLRLGGGGSLPRGRRPRAALPVRRGQGQRRAPRSELRRDPRRSTRS